MKALSVTPDWVELFLLPLLLPAAAATLARFGCGKWYFSAALVVGGAGTALASCGGEDFGLFYAGIFAVETALFSPLLLIPARKKRAKKSGAEKMYEKFHAELEEPFPKAPPKVCCFGEEPLSPEESGFRLSHVETLLGRLRASPKLSAGDRLETDVLARSLESYRNRALGREELGVLNDCLASVLKMTAKYQL